MKKTCYLTPFRYVAPADYEAWFEALAGQGWHPVKIGQWSSIAMRFDKGEPRSYRYVVDLQAAPKKHYRQAWEEFGWEFVGQMASMRVWRKAYTDTRPESFSDVQSKRQRDSRVIAAVMVSFVLFLVAAAAFGIALSLGGFDDVPSGHALGITACGLMTAAALALLFVILRIRRKSSR